MAEQRAASGWVAWWWIWLLIIIGMVWFGGWGWGGYGGWWWGARNRAGYLQPMNPATNGQQYSNARNVSIQPHGQGVAVLDATDKQSFVGQKFDASNVVVSKKVNNHALWISANTSNNNGPEMLVVLSGQDNNASNAAIHDGERVTVTGNVIKAPAEGTAKKDWSLSEDGAKRLEQEGAYIQASQVEAGATSGAMASNAGAGGNTR